MVSAVSELDHLTHAASLAADDTAAGVRAALDQIPWFEAAIHADRAAGRFQAWGQSTIVDEHTGTPLLSRALFDDLHRSAGIDADWPIGNAGLLHCYGYLLSSATTPYGLKRDRWIGAALASACGLPADAFHPWREESTLLTRATRAATAVRASPGVEATRTFGGREAHVAFASTRGPSALAFAIAPRAAAPLSLITMFPVTDSAAPLADFTAAEQPPWNAV